MGDESMTFEYVVAAFIVGVPAVAGLLTMVAGLRGRQRVRRLLEDGHRIVAVVDGNELVERSEGRTRFLPVVRFHTRDGREIRTSIISLPSLRSHPTDVPMDIIYDPADPQHAIAADDRGNGGFGVVLVGALFLIFSAGAYLMITRSGFLN